MDPEITVEIPTEAWEPFIMTVQSDPSLHFLHFLQSRGPTFLVDVVEIQIMDVTFRKKRRK